MVSLPFCIMKKIEPQQVGDIIEDVFRRAGQTGNVERHRALINWVNIVGSGVNQLTTQRYVTDQGVMHVYISSSVVKNDLMFMRGRLIEALNQYAGASDVIKDLIIH